MIALVAVFALLVQALIPSLAAAGPAGDPAMVICTTAGAKSVPAGDAPPAQSPAGHACQHCLCPAPASAPPQAPGVQPVAYVVTEAPMTATPRTLRPPTRAPPRPPGQGPPSSDA